MHQVKLLAEAPIEADKTPPTKRATGSSNIAESFQTPPQDNNDVEVGLNSDGLPQGYQIKFSFDLCFFLKCSCTADKAVLCQ